MAGLETTPESVDYAASILDPPSGLSNEAMRCRLEAFGELLELLVLSDTLYVESGLSSTAPAFLNETGFRDAISLFQGPERDEKEWLGAWGAATQLLRFSDGAFQFRLGDISDEEFHAFADSWFQEAVSLIAEDSVALRDFVEFMLPYATDDEDQSKSYRSLLLQPRFRGNEKSVAGGKIPVGVFALGAFLRGVIESALVVNGQVNAALVPIGIERRLLLQMPVLSPASMALMRRLKDERQRELVRVLDTIHARYSCTTSWPALFASIVSEASSLSELYEVALGWRSSKEVRRYRTWCNELDDAMAHGSESDVIRLVGASTEYIQAITKRSKGLLDTVQLQVSFPPSIALSPAGLFTTARNRKLVLLKKISSQTLAPAALNAKLRSIFGVQL